MNIGVTVSLNGNALDLVPELSVRAFICEHLGPAAGEVPKDAFRDQAEARAAGLDPEQIAVHPRIAIWRETYRRMGLKSEFRSSVEQLARRARNGNMVHTGIWTVDWYNSLSVAYLVPMGGYDLDTLPGSAIEVRPIDLQHDRFEPIGGGGERFSTQEKVLVYGCGTEIICWALNHRDSSRTCLRKETGRALFVSEAVDEEGRVDSFRALGELRAALARAGAACSQIATCDGRNRRLDLQPTAVAASAEPVRS